MGRRYALVVFALVLMTGVSAAAQGRDEEARARAGQLFEAAEADYQAERYGLAAQKYLDAYDLLVEMGNRMAPLALWNAGETLTHIPGREREARQTIQRFIDESTSIGDEAAGECQGSCRFESAL